eukprot:7131488-Lingulodinium_polyedra.AAC.1
MEPCWTRRILRTAMCSAWIVGSEGAQRAREEAVREQLAGGEYRVGRGRELRCSTQGGHAGSRHWG